MSDQCNVDELIPYGVAPEAWRRNGAERTAARPQHSRDEIVRTLRTMLEPGDVTELRALDATIGGDRRTGTVSGYFDSPDRLADAVERITSAKGIYVVPNQIDPALIARAQNRIRIVAKDPLTSDNNVLRRRWLLIDCDPVRPSGISATDGEHELAHQKAALIRTTLTADGWPEPFMGDSGNGFHLLYRIDLQPDDGGVVERCLKALSERFSDGAAIIDTSVHNPARIWKLYGTLACKGDATADRPHRLSKLVQVPAKPEIVSGELLSQLAAAVRRTTAVRVAAPPGPAGLSFDLDSWLSKHLPDRNDPKAWSGGGQIWTLPTCPYNAEHGPDKAFVARLASGAISAGCQHSSCQGWGWRELREKLDPQADRLVDGPEILEAEDIDDDSSNAPTRAEMLITLVKEIGRLGQTPKREAFVVLNEGPNVAGLLGGSGGWLRDALSRAFYRNYGCVLTSTGYADGTAVLRGEALEQPPEPVSLRVAPYNGGVVLDLGTPDGAAVVIDRNGWAVVPRSPVLFQRTALTGALPLPVRGGSIDVLRQVLNITDESWPLLLGWMVAALIPDIPHPILMLGGQQGTGKSSAARFICGVFDPSDVPTRSQPRDTESWAMSVANSWTTVIDNVSIIQDWWSDAMCKAVTGDGWVRRTLYTNGDVSVLSFRRVIVLTSIDAGALRGDLGERLLLIDLAAIPEQSRRPEKELEAAYRAVKPMLLGALLDLLVKVLARIDAIHINRMPRMADFALVLAAMDQALGTKSLEHYLGQAKRIASDVVDADPVGEVLLAFISEHKWWQGTASKLLNELKPEHPGSDWPKNGRKLRSHLNRLAPALKQQGVAIMFPKPTDKSRKLVLEWTAQTAQPPSEQPSLASHADCRQAVAPDAPDDRPNNRPTDAPPPDAPSGDSGRSGGLGGSARDSSGDDWGILQ